MLVELGLVEQRWTHKRVPLSRGRPSRPVPTNGSRDREKDGRPTTTGETPEQVAAALPMH